LRFKERKKKLNRF